MGKKHRIVLLDHGLYQELNEKALASYSELWTGIILRDEEKIKDACEKIGVGDKYRLFTSIITYQQYKTVMNEKQQDIKQRLRGTTSE